MSPILVTGTTGTLGRAFVRLCAVRGLAVHATTRAELDIADPDAVTRVLDRVEPWAVINAAGYVRVDDAEVDRAACLRANTRGPAVLAAACRRTELPLVTFSSDLVFDGAKPEPYEEPDPPAPLSVYGHSKLAAELRVLDAHPRSLVVRTSAFFGPWDEHNFVTCAIRALAAGEVVRAAADATVTPTYVPDLVNACLDLLIDHESGLWHLANTGALSWAGLAGLVAELAGLDHDLIEAVPSAALGWRAPRPRNSALATTRGAMLPPLEDAIERYLGHRPVEQLQVQPARAEGRR